jgi:Tfp pilus assembly protein PilX
MNTVFSKHQSNDKGSVLITFVLVTLVLTIAGLIAIRASGIDLQLADHDKIYKMTWYATNSAVQEVTPHILEEAIYHRSSGEYVEVGNDVSIPSGAFYLNEDPMESDPAACMDRMPCEVNADVVLQRNALGQSNIYVRVYGDSEFSPGNALQLPDGYDGGAGKSLAKGGAMIIYEIRGYGKSKAHVRASSQWRHVVR